MLSYIKSIFIISLYNPKIGISLLIYFLTSLSFLIFLLSKSKRYLHMLHLNSYYNYRFFKWLLKNRAFMITESEKFTIFPLIMSLYFNFYFLYLVWIIIFIYLTIEIFLKKEKKEFRFTARAVRIFLLASIFNISIIIFSIYHFIKLIFYFPNTINIFLSLSIFFISLTPFISVILSNFILYPIEKIIQSYYKNSAKKKIISLDNLKKIAIVGSYGKTSTKYILKDLISDKFNTIISPSSINTPMGLTKVIRDFLNPNHEVFIAEMGARKKGDISELCNIVTPDIAIVIELGYQHIETFKNIQNVVKTKFEILKHLPEDGVLFLNIDNKYIREKSKEIKQKFFTFSINNESDFRAYDIQVNEEGTTFILKHKGIEYELKTSLLGEHNVLNILAAISVATYLGVNITDIVSNVKILKQVSSRLELIKRDNGILVVNNSFSSNIIGAKKAIDVIEKINKERKILVTPGIVEGGKEEIRLNKEFIEYASKVCDYIIIVGYLHKKIIEELLYEISYPKEKIFFSKDLEEAKKELNRYLMPNDLVLFENDLPDNYF